jgi:hypothetical protein
MQALLKWLGAAAGLAGVLLCAVSVVARLTGQFWVAGMQSGSMLQAGTSAMVLGCLCYLALLANAPRR